VVIFLNKATLGGRNFRINDLFSNPHEFCSFLLKQNSNRNQRMNYFYFLFNRFANFLPGFIKHSEQVAL
jgi:hypothetical protein